MSFVESTLSSTLGSIMCTLLQSPLFHYSVFDASGPTLRFLYMWVYWKLMFFSNLELLCHSFNLSQWNITLLKIYSALIINITSFGEGEYPFHPTYKLSICQSCKEKISITPVVCKHFLYVYCHAPSLPRRNMWFRTMSEPKLTLSLAYDKHTEI